MGLELSSTYTVLQTGLLQQDVYGILKHKETVLTMSTICCLHEGSRDGGRMSQGMSLYNKHGSLPYAAHDGSGMSVQTDLHVQKANYNKDT